MISRILGVGALIAIAAGCTHPVEVVGQGDVESSSEQRNCSMEEARCNFAIADEYAETYTAKPRAGWQFVRWEGCGDGSDSCTFSVSGAIVRDNYGKTMPAIRAVFAEIPFSPVEQHIRQTQIIDDDATAELEYLKCAQDTVISPDGRHAYTPSFCDHAVTAFARNTADGTLRPLGAIVFDEANGEGLSPGNAQEGAAISPDGRWLFVAGRTGGTTPGLSGGSLSSAIGVYERDSSTGALELRQLFKQSVSVDIEQMRVSPDGRNLYAVAFNNKSLYVFDIAANGRLSQKQRLRGVDTIVSPSDPGRNASMTAVELSPDGSLVFAAGGNLRRFSGIAVYTRGRDGSLTRVSQVLTEAAGIVDPDIIRHISVSPDGRDLYFWDGEQQNSDSDNLLHYRVAQNNTLTFVSSIDGDIDGFPRSRWFCPGVIEQNRKGTLLYTIDHCASDLVWFKRDLATGALSFIAREEEGENGYDGSAFSQPYSLRFDADFKNAYVSRINGITVLGVGADLEISLRGPAYHFIGGTSRQEIAVFNHGPSDADGVVVDVEAPEGYLMADSGIFECEAVPSGYRCTTSILSAGALQRMILTYRASSAGEFTSTARVSALQDDGVDNNNAETKKVNFFEPF